MSIIRRLLPVSFYIRKTLLLFFVFLFCPLLAYSSPIDQMQNNDLGRNRNLLDKEGNIYALPGSEGNLYFKSNLFGDIWGVKATNIRSASIDPVNSEIIYTITKDNKVQKTIDNGKTWERLENGLPATAFMMRLFINPHNNKEVYLCTSEGLYKTNNSGLDWIATSLKGHIEQFIINPKNKLIFYALTNEGLYYSKDAGKTWGRMDGTLPKITIKQKGRTAEKKTISVGWIGFANYDSPFLLAITVAEIDGKKLIKLYRTANDGATWIEAWDISKSADEFNSFDITNFGILLGSRENFFFSKNATQWQEIEAPISKRSIASAEKGNAVIGKALLNGQKKFRNNAQPCLDCHLVGEMIRAYAEPSRTNPLFNSVWINNPTTPQMGAIYYKNNVTDEEVANIRAYLQKESEKERFTNITGLSDGRILVTTEKNKRFYFDKNGKLIGGKQIEEAIPDDLIDINPFYTLLSGKKINSVAFSPDGHYLAVGTNSDNYAYIFDTETWQEVTKFYHANYVNTVAFSPDGRYLATGSDDRTARVWEIGSWKELASIRHDGAILSLSFSPDSSNLATGATDNKTRVFETTTWTEVANIQQGNDVKKVSFSPDGRFLVTRSTDKGVFRVFETMSWKALTEIPHEGYYRAVSFSPDGRFLVTGNSDGTVRFFETENWRKTDEIKVDEGKSVSYVGFSLDNRYLVVYGDNQPVRFFEVGSLKKMREMQNFGASVFDGNWLVGERGNNLVALDMTMLSAYFVNKEFRNLGYKEKSGSLSAGLSKIETEFLDKLKAIAAEKDDGLAKLTSTKKDEFETEGEYKNRLELRDTQIKEINNTYEEKLLTLRRERAKSRIEILNKYEVELTTLLNATRKPINNLQVSLKEYNADAEIFPLTIGDNGVAFFSSYVKVPRAVARGFRDNIAKFQVSGETVLDRTGRVKLENVEIKNPETGDTYSLSIPVMNASVLTPDSL